MTVPSLVPIALFLALCVPAGSAPTPAVENARLVFATAVVSPYQEQAAAILIDSIHSFGGDYSRAPVLVVVDDPDERPCLGLKARGARIIPLEMDQAARGYPYAFKVYAAAQAERIVASDADTLVWLDAETLVLAPPRELVLDRLHAVAAHPVFLLNTIGLPIAQPVDEFWSAIYTVTGVDPATVPAVESFVESTKIRFYINCGIIAYRPKVGICQEWARAFSVVVRDAAFQRSACPDPLHRIFLHQAVLSAVILARTRQTEVRLLAPGYLYPLNLQDRLPIEKRAQKLNGLTCVIVESLWQDRKDWTTLITVDEPLRTWLAERSKELL
jgi:hypothetical protein